LLGRGTSQWGRELRWDGLGAWGRGGFSQTRGPELDRGFEQKEGKFWKGLGKGGKKVSWERGAKKTGENELGALKRPDIWEGFFRCISRFDSGLSSERDI